MLTLHDNLSDFAKSIVSGLDLSSKAPVLCPNYSVETALDLYRNNYQGNLHDALAYAYPVIEQLVGKDFFRFLTKQYIAQRPSASGNLHHYGAGMAAFIATFSPAQGLVYLSDVAALEWACHCAYFADDASRLDVIGLSKVPTDHYAELVLHIHPACQVVQSSYPIVTIWNAHQPDANSDFRISLEGGPCNAMVNRRGHRVTVTDLAEADAAWLRSIQSGVPLGKATDAALESHPGFALDVALLSLVERGILTNFILRNTQ